MNADEAEKSGERAGFFTLKDIGESRSECSKEKAGGDEAVRPA